MHEMIQGLIEKRARAWEQAKALLDEVHAANRDMTAEEREKYDRIDADLVALDERIEELTSLDARNRKLDEHRARYEVVTGRNVEADELSKADRDAKAIRSFLRGETRAIEFPLNKVKTVIDPHTGGYQVRDLTVGTATAGGNTVPTSFSGQLYEHMVEASAIRQTNATIITTAGGESLEWPKTTAFGTAAIVGEGTAAAEADTAFGKTTLGAWRYARLIQITRELIDDTGVDLLPFIAREAGFSLGQASGAHFVTGTGTNQPLGVMVAAGTGVTGGTGISGVPTADELIDLYYSVNSKYSARGYWLMERATAGKIRKITDSNSQYLWQPGLQIGQPNSLLGRPVVMDPNVAATGTNNVSVAWGDFSPYVIRDVGSIRFERSDDFAFSSDLVTFKAVLRTDGDLMDLTGAIKVYVGGTA